MKQVLVRFSLPDYVSESDLLKLLCAALTVYEQKQFEAAQTTARQKMGELFLGSMAERLIEAMAERARKEFSLANWLQRTGRIRMVESKSVEEVAVGVLIRS